MLTIISILFIIPFLMWLSFVLIKLHQQKKTGVDFKARFKEMTMWRKVAITGILLFVISSYVMSSQGFYYSFLKQIDPVASIGLFVMALYIFVKGMKFGISMAVWTIVLSLPSLGATLFAMLLMEYSYDTLQSPDRQTSLMIEHRNFTLGETSYYYRFYKKVSYLPIIERLDQDVDFFTRDAYLDDLQALGAEQAEWHNGYVEFNAYTGKKYKVKWKDL